MFKLLWPFKARIKSYDEFRRSVESFGYDLGEYSEKSVERLWRLYQQGRLDIRKPTRCDYSSSSPAPGWTPSSSGAANVAYLMGRAVHCPRPAIFYAKKWYGGLTCAYRPVQRCLKEIIWTTEYGESIYGEDDLAVIA